MMHYVIAILIKEKENENILTVEVMFHFLLKEIKIIFHKATIHKYFQVNKE